VTRWLSSVAWTWRCQAASLLFDMRAVCRLGAPSAPPFAPGATPHPRKRSRFRDHLRPTEVN
jgi:hypothetical protein